MRGRLRGRGEIPVRHLAKEGIYREADHVDDRVRNTGDLGTDRAIDELRELAIDRQDHVVIMAAIEGHAPDLIGTDGAAVGDGEIVSPVANTADLLNPPFAPPFPPRRPGFQTA